jgi:hypothetical protein
MRHPNRDGSIAQPWLTILRAAWVVLALASMGAYAAGIGPRLAELRVLKAEKRAFNEELRSN